MFAEMFRGSVDWVKVSILKVAVGELQSDLATACPTVAIDGPPLLTLDVVSVPAIGEDSTEAAAGDVTEETPAATNGNGKATKPRTRRKKATATA